MNNLKIKSRREEQGIKQEDLAKKIGVSTVTMSRYENDEREPRASDLRKIANFLNTSVAYLIGETDDPSQILIPTHEAVSVELEHVTAPDVISTKTNVPLRTPAKIITLLGEINEDLEKSASMFTNRQAEAAIGLLNLCIENFEAGKPAIHEQETAS